MTPTQPISLSSKEHILAPAYRWGYARNGRWETFARREFSEDQFFCEFGPCGRAPLDFRNECIETAKRIRDETDLPIWVLASGGMDSEIVIRAFHAAGIPVRVAINLYKRNLNLHDVSFAIATCESLHVKYRIFNDIDLEEFYCSDQCYEYSKIAQTITVPLVPLVGLLERLDGFTISGTGTLDFFRRSHYVPDRIQHDVMLESRHRRLRDIGGLRNDGFGRLLERLGEPATIRRYRYLCYWQSEESFRGHPELSDESAWDLWTKEGWHFPWYKARQYYGKEGTAFYRHTPELALAFVRDPEMQTIFKDQTASVNTSEEYKYRVYRRAWPELMPRKKHNGLELMPPRLRWILQDCLIDRQPHVNAIHRYPYRRLLEDLQPSGSGKE